MFKIFYSRTVWVIVIMFLIGGVESIRVFIPVGFLPLVEGVLGILAIYFRVNPRQEFSNGDNNEE